MRNDKADIEDILEAIKRIDRHASKGRRAFDNEELVQTWIVHHIEIIGEAARSLSDSLRAAHPEIPWPQIIAMRNVLIHHYFGIDKDEVWVVVQRDLPDLKRKVEAILKELGGTP